MADKDGLISETIDEKDNPRLTTIPWEDFMEMAGIDVKNKKGAEPSFFDDIFERTWVRFLLGLAVIIILKLIFT